MPALASTKINQTKKHDHSVVDDMVEISTTAISVIARIDYVQRFSKQMTVVVDSNPAVYSKVARQYLANLSQESSKQEVNVAFVAASNKINDIQMRCRLIEQLFANTLFDPEQSLAVSILRLAKQNKGMITIVVEHAQSLSLQVKYELCQLVDIAKKTKININVIIFGLEQTAKEIGHNKTIFDKKTSIIDASSGQVLPLDHAKFKNKPVLLASSMWLKVTLASIVSLLVVAACWFVFINSTSEPLVPKLAPPMVSKVPTIVPHEVNVIIAENKRASVADVHFAILGEKLNSHSSSKTAERQDILQALALSETAENVQHTAKSIKETVGTSTEAQLPIAQSQTNQVKQEPPIDSPVLPYSLNEEYYLNSEIGYVIQITGFSDLSRLEEFTKQNESMEFFSYQKSLNSQNFYVLTTQIYSDKAQARAAMNELPPSVKALGSFLKSVSIIKREINTVSQ